MFFEQRVSLRHNKQDIEAKSLMMCRGKRDKDLEIARFFERRVKV